MSNLGAGNPLNESKPHRFMELDSIRGLAALTVVISHFLGFWQYEPWHRYLEISPLRAVFAGHEAVVLFFVLSGFVLSVQCSGMHGPTYGRFLIKRFCRIYLPFAAAVVISAICCLKLYSAAPSGNPWAETSWTMRPSISQVVLLLLTKIRGAAQLNVAIWSVLLEIRVSVIFPILLWACRRGLGTFLLLGLVLSSCVPFPDHGVLGFIGVGLPVSALFTIGILLHENLSRASEFVLGLSRPARFAGIIAIFVCFEAPVPVSDRIRVAIPAATIHVFVDTIVGVAACGIIVLSIHSKGFLQTPLLSRLGALSYSTYLMHPVVLFILVRLYFGRLQFLYLLPLYLAAVYLASELFHAIIDRPSVLLGRRAAFMSLDPSKREKAIGSAA